MKFHALFMLKLNFWFKKKDEYANNLKNSSTTKIGVCIPCGYSMSNIWAFDNVENKHTLYRGEYCLKKFCTFLKSHPSNVIQFEKK